MPTSTSPTRFWRRFSSPERQRRDERSPCIAVLGIQVNHYDASTRIEPTPAIIQQVRNVLNMMECHDAVDQVKRADFRLLTG